MTTRCLKLNNPGSIRIGLPKFKGETIPSTDDDFREFETLHYGLRAIAMILITYHVRHFPTLHIPTTLRNIIYTWAPPSENNSVAYLQDAADITGFHPDAPINMLAHQDNAAVTMALCHHEQGQAANFITDNDYAIAVNEALTDYGTT